MAESGFLSVRCPGCGVASDRVPERLRGRTVRCPKCSRQFTVDAPPEELAPGGSAPPPTLPEDGAEAAAPTVADDARPAPTAPEGDGLAPTAPEAPAPGPPAATGVEWKPGDVVLGLYEVLGVLGQGGMGRVYRVRHRGWELDLAVKVPLPAVLEASGGADLYEREAETWVNLGLHPHVVTCHYVRRVDGLPLVFAECVEGGSLHDAIRSRRLGSAEALLDVAIQFAWGLHHAHEQGLVHRDVKPANVLLAADGLAKVTDFGLARAHSARLRAPVGDGGGRTVTVEGGGGGTPAYLSPEQAAGQTLSRRSDIWSFALSVLEAFLGARTWEYGLAAPEVLEAFRREGCRSGGGPAMPDEVADLLARCFRDRAEERPHDLVEVAGLLRAAWEGLTGRPYAREEPKGGPGSPDALNNRAVSLVDLGRHAEAATLWTRALEAEAQHVEATYNAGIAAWTAGRETDPELLRRVEDATTSHPGRARAQQLLGRVHLVLGQPAEAMAAFQRAAALGGTADLPRDLEAAAAPPVVPPRTLRGLPAPATALALSPDRRTVAAGGGGEARVWDAASGTLLRTLTVPEGRVRSLALLPDARSLLVGAEGAPLTLWDLATGRPVRSWARHAGFTTSLALAPGGRLVVSGGSDRVVRLFDPETGSIVREMVGHEDAVTCVAAGRAHAVSASRDGTARLWALDDGRCLATLRGHPGKVLAVALDEGRARIVTAGDDGTVRDWGLRSHEPVHVHRSHGQAVAAVALSPDGGRIVSGSADRTVRVFDGDGAGLVSLVRLDASVSALAPAGDGTTWAAHGSAVSVLPGGALHVPPAALCRPSSAAEEAARAAAFSTQLADARRSLSEGDLATAVHLARRARSVPGHERSDAALSVWDDLVGRMSRRALLAAWESGHLEGHADQVLSAAVDGTGARALTAGLDGKVLAWDLAARKVEATLAGHGGAATAAVFAGATRALSASRDRTLRLWDLGGRQAVAVLEGHADVVTAADAAADGLRAVSASWDGTVRLWDLRTHQALRVLEGHDAQVAAVRLSADGQVVVSGGWDGTARLWDAASGAPLGTLDPGEGNVTAVAIHADGRQVATGGQGGSVQVWDVRTRRAERRLVGHQGEITGLVFTPDGRFLLSGSRDRTVRVWDLRRGEGVRTLAHPALVLGLALTPVASALLTAGSDHTVRLWHLDWEPDTEASAGAGAVAPTTRLGGATVRTRLATAAPSSPPSTLREELRHAAPLAVPALPRAARVARRVPGRLVALAGVLLAATVVAWLAWRTPASSVRLSPYMAEALPREVDLVDLRPFRGTCSPGDFERHLESLRSGNPDARDLACLAEVGGAEAVAAVLDGAPLTSPDPLTALRLRRSAASVLAGLEGDAVAELCTGLEDERPEARDAVSLALGVLDDPAAADCIRDALATGSPGAKGPAALALRQRLARGLFPVPEAWDLARTLLGAADPDARYAGLQLATVFAADSAEPAIRPLLDDPDPDVAAAAGAAIEAIGRIRRTDQLRGGSD